MVILDQTLAVMFRNIKLFNNFRVIPEFKQNLSQHRYIVLLALQHMHSRTLVSFQDTILWNDLSVEQVNFCMTMKTGKDARSNMFNIK